MVSLLLHSNLFDSIRFFEAAYIGLPPYKYWRTAQSNRFYLVVLAADFAARERMCDSVLSLLCC